MRFKKNLCKILIQALCFLGHVLGITGVAEAKNLCSDVFKVRVPLVAEGPLQKLLTEGKADYLAKGKKSDFFINATFTFKVGENAVTLPVEMSLRGQTSVSVMDFPKYKIKILTKNHPLLNGLETLKVVSHGWEKDSDKLMGEGAGIRATPLGVYREASVYDLLREAGLPVAQGERAKVTYQYTDLDKKMDQPALLLETYEALGKRVGGLEIPLLETRTEYLEEVGNSSWSPKIWLAEMMIGNWDFALPTPENFDVGLHNITLIRMKDRSIVPYMEDFNMASMVSLNVPLDQRMSETFHPNKSDLFRSMLWNMSTLKEEFSEQQIRTAVQYFLDKKDLLLKKVSNLEVDEKGRKNIRDHLLAFFEILSQPQLLLE